MVGPACVAPQVSTPPAFPKPSGARWVSTCSRVLSGSTLGALCSMQKALFWFLLPQPSGSSGRGQAKGGATRREEKCAPLLASCQGDVRKEVVAMTTGASSEVKRGNGSGHPRLGGVLGVRLLTLGPILTLSALSVPPVVAPAGLASGQGQGSSQG